MKIIYHRPIFFMNVQTQDYYEELLHCSPAVLYAIILFPCKNLNRKLHVFTIKIQHNKSFLKEANFQKPLLCVDNVISHFATYWKTLFFLRTDHGTAGLNTFRNQAL